MCANGLEWAERYKTPTLYTWMPKIRTLVGLGAFFLLVSCYWHLNVSLITPRQYLRLSSNAGCAWHFVSYTPSPYEAHWVEHIVSLQQNVCEASNQQQMEIDQWMHPERLEEGIFSQFIFQNNCTGESIVDSIEPLAGLTRSPLF